MLAPYTVLYGSSAFAEQFGDIDLYWTARSSLRRRLSKLGHLVQFRGRYGAMVRLGLDSPNLDIMADGRCPELRDGWEWREVFGTKMRVARKPIEIEPASCGCKKPAPIVSTWMGDTYGDPWWRRLRFTIDNSGGGCGCFVRLKDWVGELQA